MPVVALVRIFREVYYQICVSVSLRSTCTAYSL